jgi:dCTP deaminase
MSFWSGEKLLQNQSVIVGFEPNQVDANAYNLRMGQCYFITGNSEKQTKVFLQQGEPFSIPPGQFAYLMTHEELDIPPNAMAFISMRTGVKFQGLINVSGFHVDPGYKGKLIFASFNASPSPIQICEGEAIFKLWFAELNQKSGHKHLFKGSGKGDIDSTLIRGMSKEIYSLQALADKMRLLETSVEKRFSEQKPTIDNLTFIWRAISLGVVGTILVAILTLAWPSLLSGGSFLKAWFENKPTLENSVSSGDIEEEGAN